MQRHIAMVGAALLLAAVSLIVVAAGMSVGATAAHPEAYALSEKGGPLLTPTSSPTCAPSWAVSVTQDDPAGLGAQLSGVDKTPAGVVWAVGYYLEQGASIRRTTPRTMPGALTDKSHLDQGGPGIERTLIERWNGTAWQIVPSPDTGDDNNELYQVSVVSANDIWAVGYYVSTIGVAQTLAEHWNGTAWQIVPSADTTSLQDNQLSIVQAVAANDVWAAGFASDETGRETTLIEHWNGTAWAIVASPNVGQYDNSIDDMAAISANDLWAVGAYADYAGYTNAWHTLALHWNGTAWSVVPTSAVGTGYNTFTSVSGVSANDVWAVGNFNSNGGGNRILLEHWDGSAWNVVAPPSLGVADANLASVDVLSANDVWAVGSISTPLNYYTPQGFSIHWDGTQWQIVRGVLSPPDHTTYGRYLLGVVAIAPQEVWAVGYKEGPVTKTLAEHYSTACVTCALQFSDVLESNPFFAAIECLACQGIVSGYPVYPTFPPPVPTAPGPSGTPGTPLPTWTPFPTSNPYATPTPFPTPQSNFHPNYNVTRGQLAKIISNSAGYDDPPGAQMFEDVYTYDTFYAWVNRLARRGILTGYPCGGPGEPCVPPANLPFFRPNRNATRGQIAKIMSNAAGYSEPHTEQDFADVPSTSTFYIYIARLYSRSIVGGYPCGRRGEPCVPPANLPYFRPNNNATRAQTAKMDAKALLPDCYVP